MGLSSLLCLLALLSVALGAQISTFPTPLGGSHAYDIFWVNSTSVTVAFLITNDQRGLHTTYKSTDEGLHWSELSGVMPNPDGKCYVERIYQDSVNHNQLLLVGSPVAQCGWVTYDSGNNFKYISFLPAFQTISFNPQLSGAAVGRTYSSQVYLTYNMGESWTAINATRAEWSLSSDYSTLSSSSLYEIRNNVFGYTSSDQSSFTPLFDSIVDLHRTSNLIYARTANQSLLVGQSKDHIVSAFFPFGETIPYVFSVSDDVSGATWLSTDESFYWGSIYTTGSSSALYIRSLEHVLKREDAFLDFHSVRGLPGVHLANVVVNYNDYRDLLLKTYITFDNGGQWSNLAIPSGIACTQVSCSLNLYFNYKTSMHSLYTSAHTIGLLVANGYVGASVSYENPLNLNVYLSRDAGLSWEKLALPVAGAHVFNVGANGGVLVLAPQNTLSATVYYSLDQGISFQTVTLSQQIYVTRIETSSSGASSKFVLFGLTDVGNGVVYGLDFSSAQSRVCGAGDYEEFIPSDGSSTSPCWLGQQVVYSRRIRNEACTDTRGEQQTGASTCVCTEEDYECDFGFEPSIIAGNCIQTGTLPPDPPTNCVGTYERPSGFRLVPGDKCHDGVDMGPTTIQCPATPSGGKPSSNAWVAIVVVLVVAVVLGIGAFIIYRDPALREKVASFLRLTRSSGGRYGRVGRAGSLAAEEDFGIHDDLLEDGSEEEDAKVLHDNDISTASSSRS